ncbi:MAG: GNAT family N-acetyltransferase [Clostridium sp.]|nr:GNAT family N-acetyltransferase [Clostridium sp.]
MEKVKIKNSEFYFEKGYRDDDKLRKSFNKLAQKTFGINFEIWYDSGYWKESYIPYSIIDEGRVVANVSVNIICLNILGEEKSCIQLGTVMTDENYRERGLSRFLIEKIIDEWKDQSDMIYLFANDTVLDFYPKFGFEKEGEYIFYKLMDSDSGKNNILDKKSEGKSYKKLNMDYKNDRDFLCKKILSSSVNSKLSMINGTDLIMFYCISLMKENIYYFKDIDTIVIAEVEGDNLIIDAVYSDVEADLDNIIERIADKNTRRVILGFTPKHTSGYNSEPYHEDDTTLFVLGGSSVFRENKIKFEPLSYA